MIIASWMTGLARRTVRLSRFQSDFLLSAKQLSHMAVCERSRVDRNGSILRTINTLAAVPRANLLLASEQL